MGQSTPSRQFADSTKLSGVADKPEGFAAIQRELNRSMEWATGSVIKFNRGLQSPASGEESPQVPVCTVSQLAGK